MSEASPPFVLVPGYLKFLVPTTAVAFKILLWGIFPGAGEAEGTPFPGRHPTHVPSHPCSPGLEQQWEGSCTVQGGRAVSITGLVGWVPHPCSITALSVPCPCPAYCAHLSSLFIQHYLQLC